MNTREIIHRTEEGVIQGEERQREKGVIQEQKAENTGRQFCSCFYQLLGIGGPEARPCQDASWGVRVGTYVSLAYHLHHHFFPFPSLSLSLCVCVFPPLSLSLSLCFFSSVSFSRYLLPFPFSLLLFGEPVYFLHLGRLDDSFLPHVHFPSPPSHFLRVLVLFIELGCLRVPLGSSGSPFAVHSLRGMPYIYAR